MKDIRQHTRHKKHLSRRHSVVKLWLVAVVAFAMCGLSSTAWAQTPGTTPVKVSHETQMLHGRKYYVHIVETGQTVYSIARAYKVQSYDAVTHQDIHFLHAGDTVWLPCRGQFSDGATDLDTPSATTQTEAPSTTTATPAPVYQRQSDRNSAKTHTTRNGHDRNGGKAKSASASTTSSTEPPQVRKVQGAIRVALMMPLHLNQIDKISTTKFDVEQRGKRTYKEFEFIEFYEGVLLALDSLEMRGIDVELNVVDVDDKDTAAVARAFASHHVASSDVVVALLLRDAFDKAATLAQQAGVYIVNPMATRAEICAENPYAVKIQPATSCKVGKILDNIQAEHPNAHLLVMHSGSGAERALFGEVKRQLEARSDIPYTLFNWSQNAKLASILKQHPNVCVLSLYDQGRDQNRLYVSTLLNRLASVKSNTPTLYSLNDLTRDIPDIDFVQLQQVQYHTFCDSWDMTNTVHVDFLKAFRTRFGTEPTSSLAPTGYNIMLYICSGLNRKNSTFWLSPIHSLKNLTYPIYLQRHGAGLENHEAQLFEMRDLRFVPAVSTTSTQYQRR